MAECGGGKEEIEGSQCFIYSTRLQSEKQQVREMIP
jgi:hypothetical protein